MTIYLTIKTKERKKETFLPNLNLSLLRIVTV